MPTKQRSNLVLVLLTAFFVCCGGYAQTQKQKELEAQKKRLEQQIKQINSLLSEQRKEKANVLGEVESLDQKIKVREQLIRVTNSQANLLNRQINTNLDNISRLRNELESLKEDYAAMIQKSYKSKSQESRLMFLLSSDNFFQGYKRFMYMKQYTDYRKEQGEQIQSKTTELQELNKNLLVQKKEKDKLVAQNREEQKKLEEEKADQQELIASIKKKESQYAAQIRKKQKEADAIDAQIERIIREAIARSKAKAAKNNTAKSTSKTTTTKASSFALTPEAKLIGNNFQANKGRLPWPVEKGIVISRFGKQRHPVVKSVYVSYKGVRISTEKGAKARAIFDGKVLAVQIIKGGNKSVLVQHGDYISVYNNLDQVSVKEGQSVKGKQELGVIFTNKATNETVIKFNIYGNDKFENPSNWINKM